MHTNLSALQLLGLIVGGVVTGVALIILLLGWLASLNGDDSGSGCIVLGGLFLVVAGYILTHTLFG
jgi:hypothetical protein